MNNNLNVFILGNIDLDLIGTLCYVSSFQCEFRYLIETEFL